MRTTIVAALIVAIVCAALIVWNARHPLPTGWDEANYINQAFRDVQFARGGGMTRAAKAFVFEDVLRPPAYRVISLPVTLLLKPGVRLLRTVVLVFFIFTAFVVWLAARRAAGNAAGAFAAMLFAVSPGIVLAAEWYGTEYPLLLACALLVLAMTCPPRADALLTAAAVALGLLSKTSFLLVAGPLLAARFLLESAKRRLVAASAAGALLAAPWWFWNWKSALEYANWGRIFPRAAFGGGALVTKLDHWLIGTIGIASLAAILVTAARPTQWRVAAACAFGALTLPLFALFSPFLFERHVAPSVIPLAVGAGIAARRWRAAGFALLVLQLVLLLAGVGAQPLSRKDNVDWAFLHAATSAQSPHISFFGLAPGLTPPEIEFAWVRDGKPVRVEWLWRMEEGPIDWRKIDAVVRGSDVVLVPDPATVHADIARGLHPSDLAIHNEHDADFVRLVRATSLFDERVCRVANVNSYMLHVFTRKRG